MVVDLPAPFGPRNPTTWPRSTANDTWSTAVTPSKRLDTRSNERKDMGGEYVEDSGKDGNHPAPHSSSPRFAAAGVADAYSDFRKAIRPARSAAGRALNRSRAPEASPPWDRTACSSVVSRPSCRNALASRRSISGMPRRSEEHTSELQSPCNLVCRLLLEKKKKTRTRRESMKYTS